MHAYLTNHKDIWYELPVSCNYKGFFIYFVDISFIIIIMFQIVICWKANNHHHHLSLNCEGHWSTTDDFSTSFLHFSLFSTALWELSKCPFPDVVFSSLPLSAFSSSPFHCALQDGFGQTWWTGDMTIPLQFASLYNGQEVFVWSDCLLDLGTDFLVGNMVFVWDA